MEKLKSHKIFEGETAFWTHHSETTKTPMKFSTFIPKGEVKGCLIWLSGLTCTDENFITKAGAQKYLNDHNLMVICPDTSPRGLNLPLEHDAYDFGSGASFYVDATTENYKNNYQMYSYISNELYEMIVNNFKVKNVSIFGHSMGGHGALTIGLKNAQKFKSISAFSPIVNPINSPWGVKAFNGYLGPDNNLWQSYDSCELLRNGNSHSSKILIHQGLRDEFLDTQLLTGNFTKAATSSGQKHEVVLCEGYDHSYYFISTFISDHISHHAKYLI